MDFLAFSIGLNGFVYAKYYYKLVYVVNNVIVLYNLVMLLLSFHEESLSGLYFVCFVSPSYCGSNSFALFFILHCWWGHLFIHYLYFDMLIRGAHLMIYWSFL